MFISRKSLRARASKSLSLQQLVRAQLLVVFSDSGAPVSSSAAAAAAAARCSPADRACVFQRAAPALPRPAHTRPREIILASSRPSSSSTMRTPGIMLEDASADREVARRGSVDHDQYRELKDSEIQSVQRKVSLGPP